MRVQVKPVRAGFGRHYTVYADGREVGHVYNEPGRRSIKVWHGMVRHRDGTHANVGSFFEDFEAPHVKDPLHYRDILRPDLAGSPALFGGKAAAVAAVVAAEAAQRVALTTCVHCAVGYSDTLTECPHCGYVKSDDGSEPDDSDGPWGGGFAKNH